MKPMARLLLSNMAQKLDSEFTSQDLDFFCEELVGRFPATADLLVAKLQFMIQDRDEKTVNRLEEIYHA